MRDQGPDAKPERDRLITALGVVAMLLTLVAVVALDGVVALHLAALASAFLTGRAWERVARRKAAPAGRS